MIHIITPQHRSFYASYLERMHRQRHKLFVERNGWTDLESPFGLEIDEYDTENATYFLKITDDGKVLGGMRTVPTNFATMVSDHFADICVIGDIPRDPLNWEMSRYYVTDPEYRSESGHFVKQELFVAIIEYALSQGIRGLSGVMESFFLARASYLPWDITPLSLPHNYGQGECVAITMDINEDMLAATKTVWKMPDSVIAAPCTRIPAKESTFDAGEVRILARMAAARPELLEAASDLIHDLGSQNPGRVERAERVLEAWSRQESLRGLESGQEPHKAAPGSLTLN